jgi:hypothetical protein
VFCFDYSSFTHPGEVVMRMWLALLAVAGACVAALLVPSGPRQRPAAADDADDERLDRLERELETVRAEVAQLRRERDDWSERSGFEAAPTGDEAGAQLAGPSAALPADEGAPAIDRPGHSAEAYVAFVADRFEREDSDPAWDPAPELSAKIDAVLPAGSSVRALDCRASLCRVETAHSDEETLEGFNRHFMLLGGEAPIWSGASVFHVAQRPEREGDQVVAVAYLARSSLPVAAE